MTLRTSLFNSGIYKSTVKRFRWGSFLYFVILFFCVPFMLLVQDIDRLVVRFSNWEDVTSIIFLSDYRIFPILLTLAVPTVAAVLIFNHVHSGKQSIFVHGLPVTRKANYISSLLAGFTLMALPVLLNGLILLIMSVSGYGQVLATWDVVAWMGMQLAILFIMFSVATFTAFLTGNAAAHIVINIFVHVIPLLLSLTIVLISNIFLFGFVQADNFVANTLTKYTPMTWLFNYGIGNMGYATSFFDQPALWIYLLGGVVVYLLSYLLYKHRRVEASGDVAAFQIFQPILKYAVTTAAAVAMFGILTSIGLRAVATYIGVAVATAVVYFACEMLLHKTFKVFGFYKGYLGFVVICGAIIAFCAYTSMFGYETRIPESEEIASAAVFESYGMRPSPLADTDVIETTRSIHQELIQDIPVVEEEDLGFHAYLRVVYKLKNGKEMHRRYRVPADVHQNAMSQMYMHESYKMQVTGFDNVNIENVTTMNLSVYMANYSYQIALNDDASELLAAVKKDVEALSYQELKSNFMMDLRLSLHCTAEENERLEIFDTVGRGEIIDPYTVESFEVSITPAFVNAYAFLKEKGYYEEIITQASKALWLCKKPITREPGSAEDVPRGEVYSYKEQSGKFHEFQVSLADCVELRQEDARRLIEEFIRVSPHKEIPAGESYFIFNRSRDAGATMPFGNKLVAFTLEEMPEYLHKYLAE